VTSTLLYYRSPWTLANFGEGIAFSDNFKSRISTQLFGDEALSWAYKSYSQNHSKTGWVISGGLSKLNVRNLKKPITRKGTPPPQSTTSQNLAKPASGEKVPLQLKISPELRREFRVYAAERDIDMSVLFADMWAFYKERHG
jgi:hypothetical protein